MTDQHLPRQHPPAAWLTITDPDDTEHRHRWPARSALPRTGEHIRVDHGTHTEQLLVVDVTHLLTIATGSHTPCIHTIPDPEET